MGIKKFFGKKKVLDTIDMSEIQMEYIQLDNRAKRIMKEIDSLEEKKKKLFKEGVGANLIQKKMLAQKIKTVEMEITQKYNEFNRIQKQQQVVSNLRMIKSREKELKKQGIWSKLQNLNGEELEEFLASVQLQEAKGEDVVEKVNMILSDTLAPEELSMDEDTKGLMDMWSEVEQGNIEMNDAEEELSFEAELKKKKKNLEEE